MTPRINYGQFQQALQESTARREDAAGGDVAASEHSPAERAAQQALLMQALLPLADRQQQLADGGDPDAIIAVDHEAASLLQTFMEEQTRGVGAKDVPLVVENREVRFDSRDVLGWARSFFTWRRGKTGRHPWLSQPGEPQRIPNHARIAVLGDWGTGMYGAPVCARTIAGASPAYDVVLHLGDVYYSGTPDEIRTRFLDIWPRVPGAVSRACNSNHEMYAGGFGYFEQILPEFKQKASFFCLENDHFRMLGLDSGYVEGDLAGEQAAWAAEMVASAGGRKILLFSHHQPYSLFEGGYKQLVAALQPLLEQRRVHGWWWGHEHRCVLYNPHPIWGLHGRCIGHSGYPYFRDSFAAPAAELNPDGSTWRFMALKGQAGLVLDGPNPHVEGKPDKYGPNGFAALELDASRLTETILSARGDALKRSDLS